MIYKNQYFTLRPADRKVYDENGKQVHVTGNAYIMLEFLCKNKSGTIIDIGHAIDFAAEFDENDIRQLRYKIKTAIGHDVVLYQNHIYSVNGGITITENNEPLIPAPTPPAPPPYPLLPSQTQEKLPPSSEVPSISRGNKKIIAVAIFAILLMIGVLVSWFFLVYKRTTYSTKNTANIIKPQNDMVLIPAGEFIMGSTESQIQQAIQMCQEQNNCNPEDYFAEYPQHKVTVADFLIDKKEISNAEYQIFMQATDHPAPQYWNDSNLNQPNQPVVGVDWNDAKAYCAWLNKRLPTEAEREKAARGTDGRIWPWGNTWDGSKLNHGTGGEPGLDETDGYKYTAPVGVNLGVSVYGVLNMAGNVDEWVEDTFKSYIGNDKYAHSRYNQGEKVIRGGSYDEDISSQRTATRTSEEPGYKDIDIGFRCAQDK